MNLVGDIMEAYQHYFTSHSFHIYLYFFLVLGNVSSCDLVTFLSHSF